MFSIKITRFKSKKTCFDHETTYFKCSNDYVVGMESRFCLKTILVSYGRICNDWSKSMIYVYNNYNEIDSCDLFIKTIQKPLRSTSQV